MAASTRNRLILATLLALILPLTLPDVRNSRIDEPGQQNGGLRTQVDSVAAARPAPGQAEPDNADTSSAERESFLLHIRLADLRREYGMYLPADDVLGLLAAGDSAAAIALLVERLKANDVPAAMMVTTLALQCGRPPESAIEPAAWDWYARRATKLGRSEEVLGRISWLMEDESERERQRQQVACSISVDDAASATLVLLGGLGATREEFDESVSSGSLDNLLIRRYRTLGPQNPFLEYAAAAKLLKGTQIAERTEGFALLQNAALTLPAAKTSLAMCYIDDCTRSGAVPDPGATMSLLREAAVAGDGAAIRFLALGIDALGGDLPEPLPGEASPADWAEVRDTLMIAGTFGQAAYLDQALSMRSSPVADRGSVDARASRSPTASKLAHQIHEALQ